MDRASTNRDLASRKLSRWGAGNSRECRLDASVHLVDAFFALMEPRMSLGVHPAELWPDMCTSARLSCLLLDQSRMCLERSALAVRLCAPKRILAIGARMLALSKRWE
jgi:hypothetical protein